MIYILPTNTCFGIACELTDIDGYNLIYKIKKRGFEKPLAIMVEDFKWLETYTPLNSEQIEYLKEYDKPLTILTECDYIKQIINLEEGDLQYPNKDIYDKIAFRVAHNNTQKKLLQEIGPIFLTSANISGSKEIYEPELLKKEFKYYIEKKALTILGNEKLKQNSPSDIFKFIGETTKIQYLRKS